MARGKKKKPPLRRGLVLAGGVALGAYQAGALKAVREAGIAFEVIAATSIGVLHALAWNRGEMVLDLGRVWQDDVRRFRPIQPERLLRLKNPLRLREAMRDLVGHYRDSHPDPNAPGQVRIIVSLTDAATGRNVAFSTTDPDYTQDERVEVVRAATCIPPLGEPPVEVRGRRYYDGGFSNNVPVDLLIGENLDEIWVIGLLPEPARRAWMPPVRRLADAVRARAGNPWVLGAAGVVRQFAQPDFPPTRARLLVMRPEPTGPLLRWLHPLRAFAFTSGNVADLFAHGHADARRFCDLYQP